MFLELMGANPLAGQTRAAFRPNVDVYYSKAEAAMIVRMELGGVEPESLDLEVEERVLRIRGHRLERGTRDKVYQQMEIAYGPFERRVLLPVDVRSEDAIAEYQHGFLEIRLPIVDRCASKRIPIVDRDGEIEGYEDDPSCLEEDPLDAAPLVDDAGNGTSGPEPGEQA